MFRLSFLISLLVFLFFSGITTYSQKKLERPEYDSILKFQALSKNAKLSLDEQLAYGKQAVDYANVLDVDSVIIRTNHNYSALCIYAGNFEEFKRINFKTLKLAKTIKDSSAMAIANHNLGWYHHQSRAQNDSAYYYYSKAYKISEDLMLTSRQVDILINISEIQELEKDYIGSEESAIKAIKLAEHLPKDDYMKESLWLLYSRMGMGATAIKIFDKALEYHDKAFAIAKQMKDGILLQLSSENNMAHVYKEKGDFKKALTLYEEILKQKDLFALDPNFYALVLDNVAYARFLNGSNDYGQLEQMFERAYHISDSLNDPINLLNVTIDLSRFYKGRALNETALKYAEKSYELATSISSNDILLESMILLSELKTGDEGKAYLKEHIKLSDSLLAHERGIRNKFARIEFETDQMELENERIAAEKLWWTISSIVLLVTSVLVYIIITQRNKNKALKFAQDQQAANEEIYNLMLSQQEKVDTARAEEKKRISRELHDGILTRVFGARFGLDSFNSSEGEEASQKRTKYIAELKAIEDDIRDISHDLNTDFVAGSGFMGILKELIEKHAKMHQLNYDFVYMDDINWDLVSNKTKINIYRIAQESLQNIYKHAKAKTVKISFRLKKSLICFNIVDDGVGFDPIKSKKGIGIKNINARVKELNGSVVFLSKINQGTTIKVKIPYKT